MWGDTIDDDWLIAWATATPGLRRFEVALPAAAVAQVGSAPSPAITLAACLWVAAAWPWRERSTPYLGLPSTWLARLTEAMRHVQAGTSTPCGSVVCGRANRS